ncbi:hypothetical protein [Actinomadura sp. GTD37]|uniref:hypothetical protein n=1 Tax=Actinomadura sp. GTD37 TaxID=1778030 RepID=UPI0035BEC783
MGKNTEHYPIRDGMAFGSHNADGMSHDDVKKKLKSLNPGKVGDASTAYKDAADVLAEMTDELTNNFAKKIIKHWKGDYAQKALDQLGQVYTTAGKLSDDSHNNATLYSWYKHDVLDWYKTQGETMTDGYVHTGGDDKNARNLMNRFIGRMQEAFNGHPLKITKDLPGQRGGVNDTPPGGDPPGGTPPGGTPPGGTPPGGFKTDPGGDGPKLPTSDGAGSFNPSGSGNPFAPGGNSPFSPDGAGSYSPSPGGTSPFGSGGTSPFGSGAGGPGTDLAGMPPGGGGGGGLPSGGGAGFGADPGGLGGANAAGGPAGGPGGALGSGPGAGAGGAAGRGMPMGGMPMGQGAQGGKGEERERNTWLTEDEDVWGADDDTAPPVIG